MADGREQERLLKKGIQPLDDRLGYDVDARRGHLEIKQMKRSNQVLQNQQVARFEKDLERTSKQLQMEIGVAQKKSPNILSDAMLTEVDAIFQEAEDYFTGKSHVARQKQLAWRSEKRKLKEGTTAPRINTNLPAAHAESSPRTEQVEEPPREAPLPESVATKMDAIELNSIVKERERQYAHEEAAADELQQLHDLYKERTSPDKPVVVQPMRKRRDEGGYSTEESLATKDAVSKSFASRGGAELVGK